MSAAARFIETKRERGKTSVVLAGDWTIKNAAPIEKDIERVASELEQEPVEVVDRIEKLDTSGAFLLRKLTKQEPISFGGPKQKILEFVPADSEPPASKGKRRNRIVAFFTMVGEKTYAWLNFAWDIFAFIGQVSVRLFRNLPHPRHFRFPSIVRHIQETGLNALPIVGLLAILVSMVITYQGEAQLKLFGADVYTINLTVISILREMGVLITAIMVAGRSGSAFAAEIGVMKLRDEVNALTTMGLDPIEVLVLPRVIALMITLPLLTFLADVIGLVGGGLMSLSLLNISFDQYVRHVGDVATPTMFFVGMIKAPVFAFVIAIIGCYQGLNVSGSAESVGRLTTLSVVQAIFVVIMADALFSVVFEKAGI